MKLSPHQRTLLGMLYTHELAMAQASRARQSAVGVGGEDGGMILAGRERVTARALARQGLVDVQFPPFTARLTTNGRTIAHKQWQQDQLRAEE